jgi:DNA-binding transcriptional regulator YhcF (GntR family)
METAKGRGRKREILRPKEKRKLRRLTVGKVAPSLNRLSKIFGRHRDTIKKDIEDMKIIKIKRKRAPYVTEKQIKTQKVRLNRLQRILLLVQNYSRIGLNSHHNLVLYLYL